MPSFERILNIFNFFINFKKDVEIFGMYNATNLGDEAMRIAGINTIPNKRAIGVINDSKSALFNRLKRVRTRRDFIVGGGTLIHGGNHKGENRWLDYVELRYNQGARISVFGTGIAFLDSQIEERSESFERWANILKNTSDVEVRGPLSQNIASKMGVDAAIFGDFVFSLYDTDIVKEKFKSTIGNDRIIGINVGECLHDQATYENVHVHLLKELSKDFFIRFFIVTAKDVASTKKVIRAAGLSKEHHDILNIYLDPFKFMKEVIICDAFIGLKLHASGLAMITGVPTLLFEYLPKCRDFVLPIDLEHCLLNFPLNERAIERKIQDLLNNPENYRNLKKISQLSREQKRKIALRYS